jgi:hypothetical protein
VKSFTGDVMTKDLNISILMDFYGQLLSERQLDMMDMYYNQDLSLAEIAEEIEISRQGVRDSIKRGEKQLFEFEAKLGLVKRFSDITAQIEKMNEIINNLEDTDEVRELKKISQNLSEDI